LSLEEEWARENIRHKYYSLWFVLSHVGIMALIFLVVILVKYYRPLYDTHDVIVAVAVGTIVGAIYVQSQYILGKHYTRKLAEVDKKETHVERAHGCSENG
jgi:Na+/melibiose symporter-like transporter